MSPPSGLVPLAALTALAFALRIPGMDQSLYGDEHFTHKIVTENSLRDVWHNVFNTAVTPPLHYGLAWLSVQFGGDDTILVRLPSLILGTAVVPVIFLIGRRAGGARAGLLAATLIALSPFAIWYSDEGRAYATMMFLVALSTVALLYAVDGRRRGWWALFALATCGAMWTHYSAIFVLAAQSAWALWAHREHRKALLLSLAAVAVGYLPWLRGFLEQRSHEGGIEVIDFYSNVTLGRAFGVPLQTLVGHPFAALDSAPGPRGLVLVLAVAVLVGVVALSRGVARPRLGPLLRTPAGLFVILALATPVGLLLYDAVSASLYLPRNLAASLPALALVAALALDRLAAAASPAIASVAITVLLAVLATGAVVTVVDDDERRPAYREAAHYLDRVAHSRDAIIDVPVIPSPNESLFRSTTMDLYFDKPHSLYERQDAEAWRALHAGRSVYQVEPTFSPLGATELVVERAGAGAVAQRLRSRRLGGPDGRGRLRSRKLLAGIIPVAIVRYTGLVEGRLRRPRGRETISWSLGLEITVAPGVARGRVERATSPAAPAWVAGWALARGRPQLVDWVMFFASNRLVAVSPGGGNERRDLAERLGRGAYYSGFVSWLGEGPVDRKTVRAFAVVGDRASELPLSHQARVRLRGD